MKILERLPSGKTLKTRNLFAEVGGRGYPGLQSAAPNPPNQESETMRKIRHITVSVTPELYRQTRHLAAEYDTTVSAMVAYLLERFPSALKAAQFQGGPAHCAAAQASAPVAQPLAVSADPPALTPSPEKNAIAGCTAVQANLKPTLSATSNETSARGTGAVRQYEAPNHTSGGTYSRILKAVQALYASKKAVKKSSTCV